MTSPTPAPTDFLWALASRGALDVYGIAEALGIDTGTAQKALTLLVQAGTITRSAANIYDLSTSGRVAIARMIDDAMDPARAARSLVAAFNDSTADDARALVASIDSANGIPAGYVLAQRVEHGVVTYTSPSLDSTLVASLADARERRNATALTASAEDATVVAHARAWERLPRPARDWRTVARTTPRPAAPRAADRSARAVRVDRARALLASGGVPNAAGDLLPDDLPDGTVITLPGFGGSGAVRSRADRARALLDSAGGAR